MTHTDQLRRRIRAELAYQQISARELARQLGISQSAMSSRLSGEVDFRVSELEAIAEVLSVPVARLWPAEPVA